MNDAPFHPIHDDDLMRVSTAGGPELLTTADAARLLSVGQRTLWRWSRSGLAPKPLKIGRGLRAAVRFRRAELLAWINSGCPRLDGKGGGR